MCQEGSSGPKLNAFLADYHVLTVGAFWLVFGSVISVLVMVISLGVGVEISLVVVVMVETSVVVVVVVVLVVETYVMVAMMVGSLHCLHQGNVNARLWPKLYLLL